MAKIKEAIEDFKPDSRLVGIGTTRAEEALTSTASGEATTGDQRSALAEVVNAYAVSVRKDANALGEMLRAWAFVGEGYGCYSNFNVRPEFEEVGATEREFAFLWGRPFDAEQERDDSGWFSLDRDEIKLIRWFKHPNGIEMGWHWDGDGCLAFYVPELGKVLWNNDCKKDYEWEFQKGGG